MTEKSTNFVQLCKKKSCNKDGQNYSSMLRWFNNCNDLMPVESRTSRSSPVMMAFRKQSSCSNDSGSDKHWDLRRKQSPPNAQHSVPEHAFCCWLKWCGRTPTLSRNDSHPGTPKSSAWITAWALLSAVHTSLCARDLLQELLKGPDPQSFPRDTA